MSGLDWAVLLGVSLLIVGWGLWTGRGANQSSEAYLRGGGSQGWATIGLAVMATQASAITFLSVPGQAYEDGMRFVQVYLGMPLALVVVSAVLAPAYHRSKVYTAYEI
ncbi:MAG: sodium:solute symporter, partial [Deltaproteobacteria bacterium]|nr:sodium:solute symporter [Deltaproteobacteria bacterium]